MKQVFGIIKRMMSLQFTQYINGSAIAAVIDWSFFYILIIFIGIYYQFALVLSYSAGATFNYIFHKKITFKNKSKKIPIQFSAFFIRSLIALSLSSLIIFIFVDLFCLHKVISRIITTSVILFFNFFTAKYYIFNRKFFK